MGRKQDTAPERLLRTVITAFQTEDDAQIQGALDALLRTGPVRLDAPTPAAQEDYLTVRAELLQFLHSVVRVGPSGLISHGGLELHGQLRATLAAGRLTYHLDADWRHAAFAQLVFLLDRVGLRQVRLCKAGDCRRVFVKTYRREFCSARCQDRTNKQIQRHNAREARERARARRQRRRAD